MKPNKQPTHTRHKNHSISNIHAWQATKETTQTKQFDKINFQIETKWTEIWTNDQIDHHNIYVYWNRVAFCNYTYTNAARIRMILLLDAINLKEKRKQKWKKKTKLMTTALGCSTFNFRVSIFIAAAVVIVFVDFGVNASATNRVRDVLFYRRAVHEIRTMTTACLYEEYEWRVH